MTTQVKVTLGHDLGLASLAAVNTFHFGQPGDAKPANPALPAGAFRDFYMVTAATASRPIGGWISNEMSRLAQSSKVELFDLEDALPRLPYHTLLFALPTANGSGDLPGEVATVISWQTDPASSTPIKRRRGRTFIGPLVAFTNVLTAGISRPASTFRADLGKAAFALLDSVTEGLVVFSRTSAPDIATDIVGGYIDDAWDTMRSRGADATARTLF